MKKIAGGEVQRIHHVQPEKPDAPGTGKQQLLSGIIRIHQHECAPALSDALKIIQLKRFIVQRVGPAVKTHGGQRPFTGRRQPVIFQPGGCFRSNVALLNKSNFC